MLINLFINSFIDFSNFLIGLLSKAMNVKPLKIIHSFHYIFSVVFKRAFYTFPVIQDPEVLYDVFKKNNGSDTLMSGTLL